MNVWDSNSPDAELIEASRGGDREAFGELFVRHRRGAFAHARQLTGSDALAGDLVSEAFIKVLNQLDRGVGPSVGFATYLSTTIRNLYIDGYRRDKKQVLVSDVAEVVKDDQSVTPDPAGQHAEGATVLSAFATLPETWREILWRVEVVGQPHAEVAEALGMTPNAIGVAAFRAREALREGYLAQHMSASGDDACRATAVHIPRYVRGRLTGITAIRVDEHLGTCGFCSAAVADVRQLNTNLSGLLIPAIVGFYAFADAQKVAPAGRAAATSARTVGVLAGVILALVLIVASDRLDPPPTASPGPASVLTTPTPSVVEETEVEPVRPSRPPATHATAPRAATPSPPPVTPSPTPTKPSPPQQQMHAKPSPTPVAVARPGLGAPYVTVGRSAGIALVRVEVHILDVPRSEPVSLFVDAANVSVVTADAGWICESPQVTGDHTRVDCARAQPGSETFAVTLQAVDPAQSVTGQIGFIDQTQVISFVAGGA